MKYKLFICLTAMLLLVSMAIIGCDNEGGGEDTRALTENDFANDAGLRADPENDLIVKFLEHPSSETPENDTNGTGIDTIPYTYTRTVENTFCWEDDDGQAGHFMELDDSQGNEVFRLDVNGDCVTVVLEAGDYVMHIHHDGRIENIHAIFIIPERSGELAANKEKAIAEGIVERAGRLLSSILENLDISFTQTSNAQTVADNINTLLSTNSCVGCDLTGADLTGVNLFRANLGGAILRGSLLTDANLNEANLTGADLSFATWCEGSICPEGSIGTCELMTRFLDNCDGTVSDRDTGLMWEQKVDGSSRGFDSQGVGGCRRCLFDLYSWNDAMSEWISAMNGRTNDSTGSTQSGIFGHSDWRLPTLAELLTILDVSEGSCGGGNGACINSVFGPTVAIFWTSTTVGNNRSKAWAVNFEDGSVFEGNKPVELLVRAVRTIQ